MQVAKQANSQLAPNDTMQVIPQGFNAYKKTPTFNQDTVPKGLIRDHKTAARTWAAIVVESGKLEYKVTEPGHEATFIVEPGTLGVIVPEQPHHVTVIGDVSFYVEFYRE